METRFTVEPASHPTWLWQVVDTRDGSRSVPMALLAAERKAGEKNGVLP